MVANTAGAETGPASRTRGKGRRRTNGEGTVYESRPGYYTAQARTGGAAGNTRITAGGSSPAQARSNLAARLAIARENAAAGSIDGLTVGSYLSRWLREIHSGLKPGTWRRYEELSRVHILPVLGAVRLRDLRRSDIERLHTELRKPKPQRQARGKPEKPPKVMSETTRHYVHVTLSTALEAAVRGELLPTNVAKLYPTPQVAQYRQTILTRDEVKALLAAAIGDEYEAALILGATVGMRLGEILGLRWDRVLWGSSKLLIDTTLTRDLALRPVMGTPKTRHSKRVIPIPAIALDALKRRQAAGATSELVFPGVNDRTWTHKVFGTIVKRAGLPRMRFHDLRHTAATLMLQEGVHAHIVSQILGHSSVAITLQLYGHVTLEMRTEGAQAMDRLFGAAPAA